MIVRQSTQTLLTRVPETTMEEFDQAVNAASQAFKSWSKQSVLARQRFAIESVFEYPPYQRVIHLRCVQTSVSNSSECRRTCTQHCPRAGKDPCRYVYFSIFLVSSLILSNHSPDAHGDVLRGLQVVETAIAVTSNIVGEKLEGMCAALLYGHSVHVTIVSKDMDTEVRKLPLGVCARFVLKCPT